MASKRGIQDRGEKKRVEVSSLMLAGATQREIAQALSIALSTVNYHAKIIRGRWRAEQSDNVDAMMDEDLERIKSAMTSIWAAVLEGRLGAIDRLIRLIELRSSILGYRGAEYVPPGASIMSFKFTEMTVRRPELAGEDVITVKAKELKRGKKNG